jgi:hypothetical protein
MKPIHKLLATAFGVAFGAFLAFVVVNIEDDQPTQQPNSAAIVALLAVAEQPETKTQTGPEISAADRRLIDAGWEPNGFTVHATPATLPNNH